jgi:hypothetical protein
MDRGLPNRAFELKAVSGIDFRIGLGLAWSKDDPTASRDDIVDIARSLARPVRYAISPAVHRRRERRDAASRISHVCSHPNLPDDCGHRVLPRLLVLPGSRRRQRLCRPPLRFGPAGAGSTCCLAFGPP